MAQNGIQSVIEHRDCITGSTSVIVDIDGGFELPFTTFQEWLHREFQLEAKADTAAPDHPTQPRLRSCSLDRIPEAMNSFNPERVEVETAGPSSSSTYLPRYASLVPESRARISTGPGDPDSCISYSSPQSRAHEESTGIAGKEVLESEASTEKIIDENKSLTISDAKSQRKPGKNGDKEPNREARFAFLTKSDVDILEDGYRWRKYGQKAVKNSRYPRNYYRCTAIKCSVKKRIERSSKDPTILITTYEGKHTHHTPTEFRGSGIGIRSEHHSHVIADQTCPTPSPPASPFTTLRYPFPRMMIPDLSGTNFGLPCTIHAHEPPLSSFQEHHQQQIGRPIMQQFYGNAHQHFQQQEHVHSSAIIDQGLLEGIVPNGMPKKSLAHTRFHQ